MVRKTANRLIHSNQEHEKLKSDTINASRCETPQEQGPVAVVMINQGSNRGPLKSYVTMRAHYNYPSNATNRSK